LSLSPKIRQLFVVPDSIMSFSRFDAMVYLTRKEVEYELKGDKDFYISSFSTSVISYKGLLMPTLIKKFYRDLQDEDFKISFRS